MSEQEIANFAINNQNEKVFCGNWLSDKKDGHPMVQVTKITDDKVHLRWQIASIDGERDFCLTLDSFKNSKWAKTQTRPKFISL